ncbi:pyridoxal-dependent decarboxylase [Spongiactinospora gelatinilytica]|uniref:Pyridoxal-dependent decarboxylase n=1 Tax=Spongiactinospora gelatinilytica TaxID=2666298 RepID=A0A2W2GVR2_9ACTN|nr:pyridoxal-dependent decarboxylase [Spongiactinospora gelatinilytica]PZG52032.1 pyridoxal-dependent decarboxylase [Spongiactinospora gelatinilytica]
MEDKGPLDAGPEEGARLLAAVAELVVGHIRTVPDGPVAPAEPDTARIRERLAGYDFERPAPADDALTDVTEMLRRWGVHTTHPRYFGLFNPTPNWWGVAGELLAAGVNPQLAAYSHAPAAVEMERHVLRFMAARLGLPDAAEGSFTVGGAEANLTAVVVALTRAFDDYAHAGVRGLPGSPVLYASAESHLAWLKIAHMTGLGRDAVRLVPVDARHRLDLDRLGEMHAADVAAGFLPFLLVGTAGTTAGGALDPLPELAAFAAERGLHFHVDAAWAGAVALSDRLRPLLAGVELADSVTVDAHKWLSAPMGAGMFLTRHPEALARGFRASTSYMPGETADAPDPYATSVQWSRRFAGLKVFLALAIAGRPAHGAQLERDVRLGELLARLLAEDGWERINDTPLPLVCVAAPEAERDGPEHSAAWHAAIVDRVVTGGDAWVSTVRLAGRPAIRICLTSHRTRPADVEALVTALTQARTAVSESGSV